MNPHRAVMIYDWRIVQRDSSVEGEQEECGSERRGRSHGAVTLQWAIKYLTHILHTKARDCGYCQLCVNGVGLLVLQQSSVVNHWVKRTTPTESESFINTLSLIICPQTC
ncbi:hypothetical protein AOLI_G00072220 [Acnodon oligacanthus]